MFCHLCKKICHPSITRIFLHFAQLISNLDSIERQSLPLIRRGLKKSLPPFLVISRDLIVAKCQLVPRLSAVLVLARDLRHGMRILISRRHLIDPSQRGIVRRWVLKRTGKLMWNAYVEHFTSVFAM